MSLLCINFQWTGASKCSHFWHSPLSVIGGRSNCSPKPDFSRTRFVRRRNLKNPRTIELFNGLLRTTFWHYEQTTTTDASPTHLRFVRTNFQRPSFLQPFSMSISIPFQPLFRRKKNSRQQATSTGSTSGKERHGGVTTDIFVDDSMWQAVPWKFWVQRLIFGDVAWFNKYHLKRRWSTYRQMSELLPFGGGCSNLFRARGGDLRSLAYGQRPVQFS